MYEILNRQIFLTADRKTIKNKIIFR